MWKRVHLPSWNYLCPPPLNFGKIAPLNNHFMYSVHNSTNSYAGLAKLVHDERGLPIAVDGNR